MTRPAIPRQKISGSLEHDVQAEIVLPCRVFDFFGQKDRMADLVLAQHSSGRPCSQFARKRALARAGKPSHHNNHKKRIVMDLLQKVWNRETETRQSILPPLPKAIWSFCRFIALWTLDRNNVLRFPPLGIAAAHHDMEAPVAPFFFGFHQSERLHVEQVVLHPANLLFVHAAPLQVHRHAGQMR